MRSIAEEYIKLKQRNSEIRTKLKAQHKEVPETRAKSDVVHCMQQILDNDVASNSQIDGITPFIKTPHDKTEKGTGFNHLKVLLLCLIFVINGKHLIHVHLYAQWLMEDVEHRKRVTIYGCGII